MATGHRIRLSNQGLWEIMMLRQTVTMHFKLHEDSTHEDDAYWSEPERTHSALVQFDVSPPSADGDYRTVRVAMWQGVPHDPHPEADVTGRYIGIQSVNVKKGQTVCFKKLVYQAECTHSVSYTHLTLPTKA